MHLVILPLTGDGKTLETAFQPAFGKNPPRVWGQAHGHLDEKGYVTVWIDEPVADLDARVAGRDDVKVLYRDAKGDAKMDPAAVTLAAAVGVDTVADLPRKPSKAELIAAAATVDEVAP